VKNNITRRKRKIKTTPREQFKIKKRKSVDLKTITFQVKNLLLHFQAKNRLLSSTNNSSILTFHRFVYPVGSSWRSGWLGYGRITLAEHLLN